MITQLAIRYDQYINNDLKDYMHPQSSMTAYVRIQFEQCKNYRGSMYTVFQKNM